MNKQLIFAITLLLGFTSCKDKEEVEEPVVPAPSTIEVRVQPVFGSQTLYIDSTYTTVEGYDVQFAELKFYFGSPNNSGTQMVDAGLFDYAQRGTLLFSGEGDYTKFSSLNGYLGIDSTANHSDPSGFPLSSYLNITNSNDMYWGWNPGFIFMKVEARVDTIQDSNPLFDHIVAFHIGGDINRQNLNLSGLNWVDIGGSKHRLSLKLDMANFLQNGASTIDLKNEFVSHTAPGQEVISAKVISNFAASISPQ